MESEKLRDTLNAKLLNKKELADKMGVNYFDLVRFLNGKTTCLSKPQTEKAAKFLEVDIKELER